MLNLVLLQVGADGSKSGVRELAGFKTTGKEDPWVKLVCGFQVKIQLLEASYYEINPAGHCPHDEVPEVCNASLATLEMCLIAHFPLVFVMTRNYSQSYTQVDRKSVV